MPSFIVIQRHTAARLLALILLWNVVGGAFVTLGAPWLAEIAGTTELRSLAALPAGSGWLAIGVPTHLAGIWLPVLGMYALHRMRRNLRWHPAAVLFYAPQTFAITSPLHVDMWIGLFAAASFQPPVGPPIAVNWIAIALLLVHAGLELMDSKFSPYFARIPSVALGPLRDFWGATPLSRAVLARRYASIATITAVVCLPLVPLEAFYPSEPRPQLVDPHSLSAWFDKEDVMFWRRLLLLPMTFAFAYVVSFVWSGGQRQPRFSVERGIGCALLSYVHLAMAADLLSGWLSDGREFLFGLFILALVYLLPFVLLIPVIGAAAGGWLERNVAPPEQSDRSHSSRLTLGMWLTLAVPLLVLLLSFGLRAQQRNRIETARAVAQRALAHFDQNEPEQLSAMFMTESLAMIDRDSFIATLKERRESLGELRDSGGRRELSYRWYPRAEIIQFDYSRAGSKGASRESIVIDLHGPTPAVSAVSMNLEGQPPARNVFVPRRDCGANHERLHCGHFNDEPRRSLF